MRSTIILAVFFLFTNFVCGQNENKPGNENKPSKETTISVGDGCEGCDAVYETPIPFEQLSHIDTLPDFDAAPIKLEISGVIYKPDGTTPAAGIVLYLYHTDQSGYYSKKGGETGRHGYLRGWLKTNENGEYKFYTLRPAPYPNATFPAHIHPTIKEPGKTPYWLDDYVFDDDKFVNDTYRSNAENRGGDGILTLTKNQNGVYTAKRDLILGKNIPNYK
jgi:protocatechuate 3,4-dioxygenase beta subunit